VIHRDIKPSNIMLDRKGNAYLADFGIAKISEGSANLTATGIAGTPSYMAPEQPDAPTPTTSMDTYALGVTAFEMITGRLPYIADTPIGQILKHMRDPVPSLVSILPDAPPQVDAVLQRAMAKTPEARYASAGELAAAFEAAVISAAGSGPLISESEATRVENTVQLLDFAGETQRQTSQAVGLPDPVLRQRSERKGGFNPLLLLGAAVAVLVLGGGAIFAATSFSPPTAPSTAEATEPPTSAPTDALATPTQAEIIAPASTEPDVTDGPPPTTEPTATLQPTVLPATTTQHGVPMTLVDEGTFLMGSKIDEGYPRERPQHEVFLAAYYIDQTEVTNLFYHECVDAGACVVPEFTNSPSQFDYYEGEFYQNYPVIYLSWHEANTYCKWRGGHLPTEAQWEKAARWDAANGVSRLFPWEAPSLDPVYANYGRFGAETTEVGTYTRGLSPYGLADMAGNVAEWVYDWYQDNFYEVTTLENPIGPESSEFKVVRGGSYDSDGSAVSTTFRDYTGPNRKVATIGFRCAWTPSGDPTP
jgi:eukaryotic-like serine/threonine-protein kinase